MERKKRSKGSVWEFCYANTIFGTFGFEIKACGRNWSNFAHTHTHAAKLVVEMSSSSYTTKGAIQHLQVLCHAMGGFHSVGPHSFKPRSIEPHPLSRIPLGRIPLGRIPLGRIPSGRIPLGRIPISRCPLSRVPFSRTSHIFALDIFARVPRP